MVGPCYGKIRGFAIAGGYETKGWPGKGASGPQSNHNANRSLSNRKKGQHSSIAMVGNAGRPFAALGKECKKRERGYAALELLFLIGARPADSCLR